MRRHADPSRFGLAVGAIKSWRPICAKSAAFGAAYRAVYTVRYADAVYVLHAFQKKSKKGIVTPKAEIDLIVQWRATVDEDGHHCCAVAL